MAPKAKSKRVQAAANVELKEKDNRINLGDTASLKRALDEVVIEELRASDYTIDHTFVDLKIVLGLAACAVACLAHFYPLKYPASFWLLVWCVGTYSILSTAMTAIATFLEKDGFAFTKPNPKKGGAALVVGSKLPRFQDKYQLRIQLIGAPKGREEVRLVKSVVAYFDSDGHLATEIIRKDFQELLAQFEEECSVTRKAD